VGTESGAVGVLLGYGNGGFAPRVDYDTGSRAFGVTAGDFNGDGKSDLAVASFDNNTVSVLLTKGTFNLGARGDFPTGVGPQSVTAADFNGDGRPDVATANRWGDTASVLLNQGNGALGPKSDYGTASLPLSVASADFNGDGRPDLATANFNGGSASVLLNIGGGAFGANSDYTTGSHCCSIISADFNGDGRPDLATANAAANTVSVLLNQGNGVFAAAANYATGAKPAWVASADFNGDGRPDLAVVNVDSNTVSVLPNIGNGALGGKSDWATGPYPYSVAAGDFNGDGRPDLAVVNNGSGPAYFDSSMSVLLNTGGGAFAPKADYRTGSSPMAVTSVDFNGDGKADLAVANYSGTASVLLNKGDGTFATKIDYPTGNGSSSIASADFNTDGKPDLAVANKLSSTVSVLLNRTTMARINQAPGQADPTTGSTVSFLVTFSDPVSGFGSGHVILGGTAGATTAAVAGSGRTYAVTVSGMKRSGTVIASIGEYAAQDAAGYWNAPSSSSDNTVVFNDVAPIASLVASKITKAKKKKTWSFLVTYWDAIAVKAATIGKGDIVVAGPKGYKAVAKWVRPKTPFRDRASITASYSIAVPGGSWDRRDNGTYKVVLQYRHISDTAGNWTAAGKRGLVIGSFKVKIAKK